MAAALILLSWWTGIDLAGGSQDFLEILRTLTPKLLAIIVALI
jgi:hypothetical protein